jgi:hypothetical protein
MQAAIKCREVWLLMRGPLAFLSTTAFVLSSFGCGTSRISGTYIAHGPGSAEMFQLTQTDNGQIAGVFNTIIVNTQGKLNSGQGSITGVVDQHQITLTVHSFLFGNTFGGTIRGNSIHLQLITSNGSVESEIFKQGSRTDFKKYADKLKHDADVIVLSRNLGKNAQELRRLVQNAEQWITFSDLHAHKIPGVKSHYQQIEDQMRSLAARARETSNVVVRGQLSVAVSQENVAGDLTDIEVNQMWDSTISESGRSLSRTFATLPPNCESAELRKHGATSDAIVIWQTACQQAVAARSRFEEVFKRIMEQRAELKSFQAATEAHRQALVNEAWHVQ